MCASVLSGPAQRSRIASQKRSPVYWRYLPVYGMVGSMPRTREIISVPNVGGHPATAQALVEQARFYPDLNVQYLVLSGTAKAARTFHEGMTQDPNKAQRYIGDSAKRTTLSSRVYAGASALELALRAGRAEDGAPTAWTVVQEHSLLGASPRLLRHLGITSVRLTTPDVYPKDSGLEAVHKHGPSARILCGILRHKKVWRPKASLRRSLRLI